MARRRWFIETWTWSNFVFDQNKLKLNDFSNAYFLRQRIAMGAKCNFLNDEKFGRRVSPC